MHTNIMKCFVIPRDLSLIVKTAGVSVPRKGATSEGINISIHALLK